MLCLNSSIEPNFLVEQENIYSQVMLLYLKDLSPQNSTLNKFSSQEMSHFMNMYFHITTLHQLLLTIGSILLICPTSQPHHLTKFLIQSTHHLHAKLTKPYLPLQKIHNLFILIHQMIMPLNIVSHELYLELSIHHDISKIIYMHLFMMHLINHPQVLLMNYLIFFLILSFLLHIVTIVFLSTLTLNQNHTMRQVNLNVKNKP